MKDSFEIFIVGEFLGYLDSAATEWMLNAVASFYNGDAVEDLSRNHIRAVSEYSACEACLDQVDPNLKDFISLWEDDYGELDAL